MKSSGSENNNIGQTHSGKLIYNKFETKNCHKHFSREDHEEAANKHNDLAVTYQKMGGELGQKTYLFHKEQRQKHLNAAFELAHPNKNLDKEKEFIKEQSQDLFSVVNKILARFDGDSIQFSLKTSEGLIRAEESENPLIQEKLAIIKPHILNIFQARDPSIDDRELIITKSGVGLS